MSTYGLLITGECADRGRFVWARGKVKVYSYEEALETIKYDPPGFYTPCRYTSALCKLLRKNPSAVYLGPVIE